jgi:hypothetical protein
LERSCIGSAIQRGGDENGYGPSSRTSQVTSVKKLKITPARPKAGVPPKPPAALNLVQARLMPGMTTPIAIRGFVMRKLLLVALPLLTPPLISLQ